MTVLQWALLIVGAAAVIAIWWFSRRDQRSLKNWEPPSAGGPVRGPMKLPGVDQSDLFSGGEFDEFGVGKPRKRVAPTTTASSAETRPLFPEVDAGARASARPRPEPEFVKARTAPTIDKPKPAPKAPAEDLIVTLLIAEREGTAIFGPKIHKALAEQGLAFGDKKIYHRLKDGKVLFSVASLIKPGYLDPAESQGFSTPGLSVFALLPGPGDAVAAIEDMVVTTQNLARALNAEVFDDNRQPFTAASARALMDEVQAWAQRNA